MQSKSADRRPQPNTSCRCTRNCKLCRLRIQLKPQTLLTDSAAAAIQSFSMRSRSVSRWTSLRTNLARQSLQLSRRRSSCTRFRYTYA